jgi:hypothetical protein
MDNRQESSHCPLDEDNPDLWIAHDLIYVAETDICADQSTEEC